MAETGKMDTDMKADAAFDNAASAHRRIDQLCVPTLRDQFAMAVLTGVLATWKPKDRPIKIEDYAKDAYSLADAMMEARKETHNAE